jgi:dsDNA-binding SOS-regulon protein
MVMQLKNLHRLTEEKREAIALQVAKHKEAIYETT